MHISVILAHPDTTSFNHAIANAMDLKTIFSYELEIEKKF
jgi:hypothetical protein